MVQITGARFQRGKAGGGFPRSGKLRQRSGKRQGTLLFGGGQDLGAAGGKAQYPQVGRGRGRKPPGQPQHGGQKDTAQPRVAVPFGFGQRQQLLHRTGGAGGAVQAMLQPLGHVRQGSKLRLLHGAQPGQHGTLPQVPLRNSTLFSGPSELPRHGGRQPGCDILAVPVPLPQQRSGGQPRLPAKGIMGGALSGQGQRSDIRTQPGQRPQIFDGKDVVRGGEQRSGAGAQQLCHGGLPRGRKGQTRRQMRRQRRGQGGGLQHGGNGLQGGQIAAFAAENQHVDAAQGGQACHGAAGKMLGGGGGVGQRKLQYQVNAAVQSGGGAVGPGAQGGFAPLHIVTAQDGHNMGGAPSSGFPKGQQMPPVQRVPLRNDPGDLHGVRPLSLKTKKAAGQRRNPCPRCAVFLL